MTPSKIKFSMWAPKNEAIFTCNHILKSVTEGGSHNIYTDSKHCFPLNPYFLLLKNSSSATGHIKKTQGQIKPDLSITEDSYRSLPD